MTATVSTGTCGIIVVWCCAFSSVKAVGWFWSVVVAWRIRTGVRSLMGLGKPTSRGVAFSSGSQAAWRRRAGVTFSTFGCDLNRWCDLCIGCPRFLFVWDSDLTAYLPPAAPSHYHYLPTLPLSHPPSPNLPSSPLPFPHALPALSTSCSCLLPATTLSSCASYFSPTRHAFTMPSPCPVPLPTTTLPVCET